VRAVIEPIGRVAGGRVEPVDDDWDGVEAAIVLDGARFTPDALAGLDAFSHLEVVYLFHLVPDAAIVSGTRHPRGNPGLAARRDLRPAREGPPEPDRRVALRDPRSGRAANRGARARRRRRHAGARPQAVDGRVRSAGPTRQPAWASELMAGYW
jgi:hypothetical protein